jgi:hypothetical protein
LPKARPHSIGTSVFHSGSPALTFHRAVSGASLRAISRKKPFNTQQLVPAPFNEFYPKRSGPTILSLHASSAAGALPIESVSLTSEPRLLEAVEHLKFT